MTARRERAAATRGALIKAARELFAAKGFHDTGTHEIVARAGVTRGALQHHFIRKEDLFLAVFMQVEADMTAAAVAALPAGSTTIGWAQLKDNLGAYLEAATTAEVQRIILLDGPAVLGWSEWRRVEVHNGLTPIQDAVEDGIATGQIRAQPSLPLARLILSLVNEAALMVANANDPDKATRDARIALDTLLSSLV